MINAARKIFQLCLTYKKRSVLENKLGNSFKKIQAEIDASLKKKGVSEEFNTQFYDLGGVNNLGMFVHSTKTYKPFAVTKVQKTELANREGRFLEWQRDVVHRNVTGTLLNCHEIDASSYSWICFSYLNPINDYSDIEINKLYTKLNVNRDELKHLSKDGSIESLVTDLEPNTKIKKVLREIVCVFPSSDSIYALNNYFSDRELFFENSPAEYNKLKHLLSLSAQGLDINQIQDMYGLVHGDFKKQNIMQTDQGGYRVIDLQYYTYGIRLWDIAFYYSKNKSGFIEVLKIIIRDYSLSEHEKFVFALLFIVASSLHLKKKNSVKTMKKYINPAIDYCYEQSVFGRELLRKK